MFPGFHRCARAARTAAVALLFAPLFLAHPGAAACDVRLNEICPAPAKDWDGSGLFSARDDEWIELVNTGLAPVDLSTYVITDADSTWRWSGTDALNPGEHRVLFGSDAVNWQHATGASVAGFSLANAGDTVRLWHVEGADTALVESYTYKPHEAGTDRAIGRVPDASGAWTLFDGLNPYTGGLDPQGNNCAPTPREANQCNQTPVPPSSWGKVKAVYH